MFEELALEMEECHKTDNNLIFVHEKMDIDSKEVDSKLNKLNELMDQTDDKLQIKEVLMDMIKEWLNNLRVNVGYGIHFYNS